MNCERARESFAELLDPRTRLDGGSGEEAAAINAARAHLANCPDCQREFSALSQTLAALDALPTPPASPQLRRNFYAMLEEEKHSAASVRAAAEAGQRRRRARWWRWVAIPVGACAVAAAGFIAGTRYHAAPAPQPVAVADGETRREIQDLQAKVGRLEAMNQLVAASLTEQQKPAIERLQTVMTSAQQQQPTDRIINELITSLALDSSANVRLQALEALYPHADKDVVRAGVLASLSRESNPLVQLAMINFLAAARDGDARSTLEKISVSESTDTSVRDAAKRALAQL
jgi:hypothetical protein